MALAATMMPRRREEAMAAQSWSPRVRVGFNSGTENPQDSVRLQADGTQPRGVGVSRSLRDTPREVRRVRVRTRGGAGAEEHLKASRPSFQTGKGSRSPSREGSTRADSSRGREEPETIQGPKGRKKVTAHLEFCIR